MHFSEYSPFPREFKRLLKRFKSLESDLEKMKILLLKQPEGTDGRHWNALHRYEQVVIFKARMMCQYLRRGDFRLIYAYLPAESRIDFIQIYFKGDTETEDTARIKDYLRGILKA
jgi:mRNA-degrading endonuclease RelE of RelBE toxin-antitoxin system